MVKRGQRSKRGAHWNRMTQPSLGRPPQERHHPRPARRRRSQSPDSDIHHEKPPTEAGGRGSHHRGRVPAFGPPAAAQPSAQPSTFTDTVETRWALGARTLSRPSR